MSEQQDGGVVVIVAILLVVLFGVGALVLDVGNLYWERRQLQAGADAGALSAAQDLASGEAELAALNSARQYAADNNTRGAHVDETDGFVVDLGEQEVTVTAQTGDTGSPGVLSSWFAGVIGHDDYATEASATAAWGAMASGSSLPVTMSYCEWQAATGLADGDDPADASFPSDPFVIYLLDPQESGTDCTGPAGQQVPGGFGWLDPEGGVCEAVIDEFGWVPGNTGSTSPQPAASTGCTQAFFDSLIGEEVLIPIFVADNDLGGNNAEFQIIGFGAFVIDGYRVRGSWTGGSVPCSNPDRCFSGHFVEYVALGDEGDFGGTELGASVVILIG